MKTQFKEERYGESRKTTDRKTTEEQMHMLGLKKNIGGWQQQMELSGTTCAVKRR